MLDVLYEDNEIIAINKPHGLAVHRSKLVGNTNEFALQLLRDQVGQKIDPLHRLDRKTAGVLVFSKKNENTAKWQDALNAASKRYFAILRGFTPEEGVIDKPLINDNFVEQEAITEYKTLQWTEISIPFGKHKSSRYSLIEAFPKTGRMHQIRKHFNYLRHPIIGDRPHGCNKQNKLFLEKWNMSTMLLHCGSIHFTGDFNKTIVAPISSEFERMMIELKFDTDLVILREN